MIRSAIIEKVRGFIEEITPFDNDEVVSDTLIDELLNDSDTEMRRKIPIHLIEPADFSTVALIDNADGTGYIGLPSDFLRLHSFKMTEWKRTICEAISEAHPKYKLQQSTVTRGGTIKPVVVIRWAQSYTNIGCLQNQVFEAGVTNPTAFTVTEFILTDDYMVWVGGVLTSLGHSRSGNIVTFAVELPEGTEVVIAN